MLKLPLEDVKIQVNPDFPLIVGYETRCNIYGSEE